MNVYLEWSDFKNQIVSKEKLRFVDRTSFYLITYTDMAGTFETSIVKEDPATADQTDFETNYKPYGNTKYEPIDVSGRLLMRPIAAKAGWKAQFHAIRITTSTSGGVYNKKKDGSDLGFCTYTMKKADGTVTTDPAECEQTVVTWEVNHDMEIVGGRLLQRTPPASDLLLYVTAAPHISEAYGGSIAFAEGGVNLYDAGNGGSVDFDGRAAKYVPYDATYHSGRFEILLKHAAGLQHSVTLIFEFFKP